ncbi:hypothetical protein [Paenibacillus sp. FSL L8-0502]|uniref:hypothetical protein n=1 Tax=Paenibacillus sp. FSL L8-0502 TaxID=2954619 RepID=UPI003158FA39
MEQISTTYSNLKMTPYQLINVQELYLVKQLNDHTRLRFTAVVPEELKDTYVDMTKFDSPVGISQLAEDGTEVPLFSGTVLAIEVKAVRDVYYLEVEAVSHTYRLDVRPQSRSFQDKNMKVDELLRRISLLYPSLDIMDSATGGASIGRMWVQYRETDWAFLKRLASYYHTSLMPAAIFDTPKFYFGIEESGTAVQLDNYHYTVSKRISAYRYFAGNDTASVDEQDFLDYTVETEQVLELGNEIQFRGKTLYVYEAQTRMTQGVLLHTYTLTTHKGLRQKAYYNEQLTGLSLEGKVIAVERDRVKVHLDIDPEQDKNTAHWFPYATGYSAEGHSGWYVMPELGDKVRIYFPNQHDDEGIASSSVRQDRGDGGHNHLKHPDVKIFRTPHGKEIRLTPDEVVITGKDGAVFIKLNQGDGIHMVSNKDIHFSAGGNIHMEAGQKVTISAGQEINLSSRSSHITLGGDTSVVGSEVKTN